MLWFPINSIRISKVQKCGHENDSSSKNLLHLLLLWPHCSQRQAILKGALIQYPYSISKAVGCSQHWYFGQNLIYYNELLYHFPEMVVVLYISKDYFRISFCFFVLKLMSEFCLFNISCVFCKFHQQKYFLVVLN